MLCSEKLEGEMGQAAPINSYHANHDVRARIIEFLVGSSVESENIVLTASTSELQKFVLGHTDDADFFGGAMELKRKKSGDKD